MRLAGEAKGFRGTELMLLSNLLTSSWPKIRKSREELRDGNAFLMRASRTIPTADGTGFWLAPDIPHTAHEIQWVGSPLPKLHSKDLIVATLRQWMLPFVLDDVCEHSDPVGFAEGHVVQEKYLCQCDEAQHCRALIQDPFAYSQTTLEESAEIQHDLARCVLVREVHAPTDGMQLPSSRSFTWRSLLEVTGIKERPQDEIYINASVLGLNKPGLNEPGLISLRTLSLFLGTVVSFDRADSAPTVSAKGSAEWFGIAVSKRLGFLQLLTSDFANIRASISRAWRPLFVGGRERNRDSLNNDIDMPLGEVDCTGQICASLRDLGSERMCVLSEEKACWKSVKSHVRGEYRHGFHERDGFREGTMLVLCPPGTQEGDIFLVLKISRQDRDRPAPSFASRHSSSSISNSLFLDHHSGTSAHEDRDIRTPAGANPDIDNGNLDSPMELDRENTFHSSDGGESDVPIDVPGRASHSQSTRSIEHGSYLTEASEESDDQDSRLQWVPRRYDYLSLVLTPSGRRSTPPASLIKNTHLREELKAIEGHRILGDGFVPYVYRGLYSYQAQVLINA